ncbi:TPA: LOW QUALITY PROTEIN: hypothetical protein N0F65_001800, partial [Lagenidium giganteum]
RCIRLCRGTGGYETLPTTASSTVRTALNAVQEAEPARAGCNPERDSSLEHVLQQLLIDDSKSAIFSRTFMILCCCWNLMCRSANAFEIRHEQIKWSGDALCIFFAHMKMINRRPRDPRHVYANPMRLQVCTVLALGLFWACYRVETCDNRLFSGDCQYERFRKPLSKLLEKLIVPTELKRRGIAAEDIGTHSLRKGSSTYCSSGSTAYPSSAAIHLRAGWKLGHVQNTYLRYEAAGDMHVGRTVCGLPLDSSKFAILPPHFQRKDRQVDEYVELVFGNLPTELRFIAEHALASLVFHSHFIKARVHRNYRIFSSPLFQDPSILVELRGMVSCTPASENPIMPTGLPPHITILGHFKEIQHSIEQTAAPSTRAFCNYCGRSRDCNSRFGDELGSAVEQALDRCGVLPVVAEIRELRQQRPNVENVSIATVPQRCSVPEQSAKLWPIQTHVWITSLGQTATHSRTRITTPPWNEGDYPAGSVRKRLADARFLCNRIEAEATCRQLLLDQSPSVSQATSVFDMCKDTIDVRPQTERSTKRRRCQLAWLL